MVNQEFVLIFKFKKVKVIYPQNLDIYISSRVFLHKIGFYFA